MMELLKNKDENIVINILRLIMNLITQTDSESNLGRLITEANDYEIVLQLIKMIKFGPNIKHCFFSKQVIYMTISLLRSFIPFSTNVKPIIMNDKGQKSEICDISVKLRILNFLKPENIHEINEEMENAILSVLTQIARDEPDYKVQIGKEFIKSAGGRLEVLMKYFDYKAK